MDDDLRRAAIELYDRFTHDGMDRRIFMSRMVALAGSVTAAQAVVGAIAASPAAAAIVPADEPRLVTRAMTLANGYKAYVAEGRTRSLKPTVLLIHENRGLNEHTRDVGRRLALAGYRAVAPDMLSLVGGTPSNEDAAREAIGKLDLAKSVEAGVAMLEELARNSRAGMVGAVGFCWGGGYVNRLAVEAGGKLDAGVSFYGPAPDAGEAARVEAPLLIHLAELDERVNRTGFPWVSALREAGKKVTFFLYDDVNHAFHNDTSAERYNKPAAELAWKRTLRFFRRHLGA